MEQLKNILKTEVVPSTGINVLHVAIVAVLGYVLFFNKK